MPVWGIVTRLFVTLGLGLFLMSVHWGKENGKKERGLNSPGLPTNSAEKAQKKR